MNDHHLLLLVAAMAYLAYGQPPEGKPTFFSVAPKLLSFVVAIGFFCTFAVEVIR